MTVPLSSCPSCQALPENTRQYPLREETRLGKPGTVWARSLSPEIVEAGVRLFSVTGGTKPPPFASNVDVTHSVPDAIQQGCAVPMVSERIR